MEFEHVRKERERKEKEAADKLAYQKRDAEWRKRQQGKSDVLKNRQKIAQEEALNEMSTYNFEEDQEKEEEKGWYTEGKSLVSKVGGGKSNTKYQTQSSDYLKGMNSMNKNESGKAFGKFGNAREQQMKEAMKKKRNLDFNVDNYDIEELAAILKFEHVPLNKGIIQRRILELKRKFPRQKSYQIFFDAAEKRLIENLNSYNKPTYIDTYNVEKSAASKVLREQFQEMTKAELEEKKNQIINQEKDIIGIPKKTNVRKLCYKTKYTGNKKSLKYR